MYVFATHAASGKLAVYAVCIEDGRVLLARGVTAVGIGLALARTLPEIGHVAPVAVGGLIQH